MKPRPVDVERLARDVQWAIDHELPRREIVLMIEKLLRHAEPGSKAEYFGKSQLAELGREANPWRSARLSRELLEKVEDDRLWAVLGLAHTLLGNLRSAAIAYRRALAISPGHPLYSHNLGHLLDSGLDRPREALPLLKTAFRELADEPEIAGSYAHALLRSGRFDEAQRVLSIGLGGDDDAAASLLATWMERSGAPAGDAPAGDLPASDLAGGTADLPVAERAVPPEGEPQRLAKRRKLREGR